MDRIREGSVMDRSQRMVIDGQDHRERSVMDNLTESGQ